jgi:S-formylglutathione hydrolase FrmB
MVHVSLVGGWLPTGVQLVAVVLLILAAGWRTPRWRRVWLPVGVLIGTGLTTWAHWYVGSAGLAGDPAPAPLWIWIGFTGVASVVVIAGWHGRHWWRRAVSVLAVPLSVLCAALSLNSWVGYFPTIGAAWNQLTAGPLPGETDRATISAMQLAGTVPSKGVVVQIKTGSDASKFPHRGELVYLPPAWFATNPQPRLPAVMMIGGEFNTPSDWLRAGNATATIDAFATAHGGAAPVFVFVDSGGGFNTDTECVNGTRGRAADHLTKDVVPFVVSNFGVSPDPSNWGVAGFSAGGTCALDLTVMHPDLFSAFVDIAGDLSPNSGTKQQTIDRLFGGDSGAWSAFDPTTVISRHSVYRGIAGWFAISGALVDSHGNVAAASNLEATAANSLCSLGITRGVACTVVALPGKHDWPFAGQAFANALPWLAGQLETPGVPRIPLAVSTAFPFDVSQAAGPPTTSS